MPKKELQVPLSDVVHLLAGRKKKKRVTKKKRVLKRAAQAAPFTNRPGYQGFSAFSSTPNYQQFIQPPPQLFKPIQEAARAQTININSNYDPDRHRVEVVTDSKSGVLPIEINPNDIVPRIAAHRLIKSDPSLMSQRFILPPVQEPFQPRAPERRLGTNLLSREVVPSLPYDPLRPGGRPPPLLEEKYDEEYDPVLDPGKLESEEQFEQFYASSPKRLTKLTRKNPITGELEQYRRGGVMKKARGGILEEPELLTLGSGVPNFKNFIIPPGNPRDQLRGGNRWMDPFV